MPSRVALLGLLGFLAVSSAASAETLWEDSFSQDSLHSEQYVRRDGWCHPAGEQPDWRVVDGALRLQTNGVLDSKLNVMAQAGDGFTLDVRIRFSGAPHFAGGVTFCDDYRLADHFYFGFYKGPEHIGIQTLGRGFDDWKGFSVEADRWYAVRVVRRGSRFTIQVDGEVQFEKSIDRTIPEKPAFQDEPLRHTGFALATKHFTDFVVEWDDLAIAGTHPQRTKLLRRTAFETPSGPIELNVLYYKGSEAWAQKLVDDVPPWIAQMEEIIGTAPCTRVLTYNQQVGTYYDQRAGFNEWGQILIGDSIEGVGGHEECHDWQHLYGESWLTEGMADFYPPILRAFLGKGRLRATTYVYDLAPYIQQKHPLLDRLLGDDKGDGIGKEGEIPISMTLGGLKARLFWYLLACECGLDGLAEMHRRAAARKLKLGSREARQILEELTGKDLGPVFAGWVEAGKGKYSLHDVVRDQDADGFSDLDEALAGSDPTNPDSDSDGLSDGFEWDHGLDSTSSEDREQVPEAIAADGLLVDWEPGEPTLLDEAGDAQGGPDLKALHLRLSRAEDFLFVAAEFHARPSGNWYVQIDLDGGANGSFTHRVNLWPALGFVDTIIHPSSVDVGLLDWGAVDRGVEVAIPTSFFDSDKVTVLVYAGLDKGGHDAMGPVTVHSKSPDGPIAVDGDTGDWAGVAAVLDDPAGDGAADLRAVRARVERTTLYLCITYDGELPAGSIFQLDLDGEADGSWEYRILAYAASRGVQLWGPKGQDADGGIVAGWGLGCLELEIPVERLSSPSRIQLSPMIHGGGTTDAANAAYPTIRLR